MSLVNDSDTEEGRGRNNNTKSNGHRVLHVKKETPQDLEDGHKAQHQIEEHEQFSLI
jgi:hypothetical protein